MKEIIASVICLIILAVLFMWDKIMHFIKPIKPGNPGANQKSALYSVLYSIQLDVSEDLNYGYIMLSDKKEAENLYEILLKGCYMRDGNDPHIMPISQPTIALFEEVTDSQGQCQAQACLREHHLGDENKRPAPTARDVQGPDFDCIGYYKKKAHNWAI